jgi:hypothetical protein
MAATARTDVVIYSAAISLHDSDVGGLIRVLSGTPEKLHGRFIRIAEGLRSRYRSKALLELLDAVPGPLDDDEIAAMVAEADRIAVHRLRRDQARLLENMMGDGGTTPVV